MLDEANAGMSEKFIGVDHYKKNEEQRINKEENWENLKVVICKDFVPRLTNKKRYSNYFLKHEEIITDNLTDRTRNMIQYHKHNMRTNHIGEKKDKFKLHNETKACNHSATS